MKKLIQLKQDILFYGKTDKPLPAQLLVVDSEQAGNIDISGVGVSGEISFYSYSNWHKMTVENLYINSDVILAKYNINFAG